MDGRRRKTVHTARRPEERPKDASHSSTFTECTAAMLTLPSFAGPTSARSVTRTVRMRFSVGTGVASFDRTLHATDVSSYIRLPKHSECMANIQGHVSRHGNCYRRRGRRARNRVTHERTAVKIYSLLCDDCVIYDGRVGAALGLLTRQFCEATGHTEVPSALEFAFGTPKEARNTKNTKMRDPSHGPQRWPRFIGQVGG